MGPRSNGAILVFDQKPPLEAHNIFCWLFTDGQGWQTDPIRVSNNTQPETPYEPYPASYGNAVYVVWTREVNGDGQIFSNYSVDAGATWQTTDVMLPNTPNYARQNPSLVARSDGWFAFFAADLATWRQRIFCQKIGSNDAASLSPGIGADKSVYHLSPRACIDPTHSWMRVAWWVSWTANYQDSILHDISSNRTDWWYWDNYQPSNPINYPVSRPADAYWQRDPDIGAGPGLRHIVWWTRKWFPVDIPNQIWYRKNYDDTGVPCQTTIAGECNGNPHLWWGSPDCDVVDTIGGYVVYRYDAPSYHPVDTIPPDADGVMEFWDTGRGCGGQSSYYVTVLDMAENESQPSNTVTVGGDWGDQIIGLDLGTPVPTPNTLKRSGYYQWGASPFLTVDYDPVKLVYRISGLYKEAAYVLAASYYQPDKKSGRRQSLLVDGTELQHGIPLLDRPATCRLRVSPSTYQDGTIEVTAKREKGPDAVLAYLSLYRVKKGGPQSLEPAIGPKVTGLELAYPNPTSEGAEIRFSLMGSGEVSLVIYDISGRLVRQLVGKEKEAGSHLVRWDGRTASGQKVSSGVYFIRMRAGVFEATRRLVVAR